MKYYRPRRTDTTPSTQSTAGPRTWNITHGQAYVLLPHVHWQCYNPNIRTRERMTRILIVVSLVAFTIGCVSKPVSWTPDSEGRKGDSHDSRGGDAGPACTPACIGKACGDDGCGGQCGECPGDNTYCMENQCVCVPSCAGATCGSDGCDGSCGTCVGYQKTCYQGNCCDIKCTNKKCGDDGCGGVCGVCRENQMCISGICLVQNDECDDENDIPWDGCTAGSISEFRVNTTTDLYHQERASLTAHPDGSFLVAWDAVIGDADGYGIRARSFGADGKPHGDDFQVNTVEEGNQMNAAVTALPDSRYAVVWQSESADKTTHTVSGIIVDGTGPGGAELEFVVEESADEWVGSPDVCLADNAILVSWYSKIDTGANKADLHGTFARMVSLEGVPLLTIELQEHLPTPTGNAALARLSNGSLAATWSSKAGSVHETDVHLVLLSETLEVSTKLQVNAYSDGWQQSPDIANSPVGGFVVVWASQKGQETPNDYDIIAQFFNDDGTKVGNEFVVHQDSTESHHAPKVVMGDDGAALVCWNGIDTHNRGVFCSLLEGPDSISWERQANLYEQDDQYVSGTAVLAGYSFLVVWYTSNSARTPYEGIFAQRFDKDGNKLYE